MPPSFGMVKSFQTIKLMGTRKGNNIHLCQQFSLWEKPAILDGKPSELTTIFTHRSCDTDHVTLFSNMKSNLLNIAICRFRR